MAQYHFDLDDIYFNLFSMLNADSEDSGLEKGDIKDIIGQYNHFTEQEIYPGRAKADEDGVHLKDGKVVIPAVIKEALTKYYENGWFGLGLPEDIGGMPVPETVNLACTSFHTGGNVSFGMYTGLSKAAMNVIRHIGTEDQKAQLIPKMMDGTWGGTMCLTESGAGSDVGAATTSAKKLDDGSYAIKGVKIFISSGDNDFYENIIHLVLARTPGAPEGTKGLSLFIVPKYLHDNDGNLGAFNNVTCNKVEEKMGLHGSSTCEMEFGSNGKCIGHLIGKEFDGMANMFLMMNEARLLCGMQGETQANLAYELTKQYASERSQFGVEIEKHPDVAKTLLKMRAMGRGMRALNLYVADLFDRAKKDDSLEQEIAFFTPISKSFCSDKGFEMTVEALQVHGGYGYCTEYGIEQFVRDTKIASIYEGTNGIQAIDFITRKNLKEQGATFLALLERIKSDCESAANIFPKESKELAYFAGESVKLFGQLGQWASNKEMNSILYVAKDFLDYSSHLFLTWILLQQGVQAQQLLDAKSNDYTPDYLESKVEDVKVYCRHFLSCNYGLIKSIMA